MNALNISMSIDANIDGIPSTLETLLGALPEEKKQDIAAQIVTEFLNGTACDTARELLESEKEPFMSFARLESYEIRNKLLSYKDVEALPNFPYLRKKFLDTAKEKLTTALQTVTMNHAESIIKSAVVTILNNKSIRDIIVATCQEALLNVDKLILEHLKGLLATTLTDRMFVSDTLLSMRYQIASTFKEDVKQAFLQLKATGELP